jgi:beta-lactamase regulating signal transducer with metallopeptidase domain
MMTELSLLLKATILLGVGLFAARIVRRSRASVRHLVLAATFGGLLALPLVAQWAPRIVISVPVAGIGDHARTPQGAPTFTDRVPGVGLVSRDAVATSGESWAPSWPEALRMAWAAGAAMLLASLAAALWRLRAIRRSALPCLTLQGLTRTAAKEAGVSATVDVVTHERVAAPLAYGIRRSTIVMPSDVDRWKDDDVRRALIHEIEHVRRGDWLIQLVARVVCAVYWFHPLVWVAWRQLSLNAERACDDAVARSMEGADYAEQLVLLARRMAGAPAPLVLSMASRSDLSARVAALLDPTQRRGRAGGLTVAAVAVLAALAVGAMAPFHAVAAGIETGSSVLEDVVEGFQESRGSSLDRSLYRAAERGNLNRVAELIDAGANVNARLHGDGSPLIGAAREGRLAVVGLLLERGADPNLAVEGDGNPLIMAAREGHLDVVTLLLDKGAQVDMIVPADENALIQASGEGHLEVVKLLVSRGANVNARAWAEAAYERPGGEWRTPLSMARKGGHTPVVEFLQNAGAK